MQVIIIGAGTGGLCLAQGLRQAGINVAVYERDRTRRDGLQGYRVGIDPDGSRGLAACLPAELFATFAATCARTPDRYNMLTEHLDEVLSLSGWRASAHDALNSEKSVSRMTLRQVLLTGLENIVHFDKTFTRYEQHTDGTVTAHFADGATATGDILVAADGSNSRVRRQYLPHASLTDTGLVGITGKVPMTEQNRALLTPRMLDGISMIFAPGGYSCIVHVMDFPWDVDGAPKTGIGSTSAALIADWPGLQFDNSSDYIQWGFAGARRNLPPGVLDMTGPQLHTLVRELTTAWHPRLHRLFAITEPATCFPLNIRTSVPIPQWPASNITLLGDAIHTMTPGRGVGANTALRDARLLCRNLTAVRDGITGLHEAVHDYETGMISYGFDAVKKSLTQMSGDSPIHKPLIGRAVLTGMRTTMRIVNHLPPVRNRMAKAQRQYRGHDRDDDWAADGHTHVSERREVRSVA